MAISHCIRCKSEIDRNFKACPHCGEPVTDFLRRYADEPVDGKYQIVERLGTGGMGEVYKATHTFLGSTRVIKVIRPQISDSQDAHDRFLRVRILLAKVDAFRDTSKFTFLGSALNRPRVRRRLVASMARCDWSTAFW